MSRQYVLGMPAVPRSRPLIPWTYRYTDQNQTIQRGVAYPTPGQIFGIDAEVERIEKLRNASKDPDKYLEERQNAINELRNHVNTQYENDYHDLVVARKIPEAQAQELALAKAAAAIQVGMAVINAEYPETFGTHKVEEAAWRPQLP
jgi:hypothetical protein